MPIGLAAFTRYQNKHNEIRVVVQDRNDTSVVKNLKSIVETMTCLSPNARIAASEVEKRLEVLKQEFPVKPDTPMALRITSQFNITEDNMVMDKLCYTKNNLVAIMHPYGTTAGKAKLYDKTINLVKEWKLCHSFHSTMGIEIQGKEYLLDGCTISRIIRGYELPQIESKILCEGISPRAMCKGPDGTMLVFDDRKKSLKQLRYWDGKFILANEFPIECDDVHSLCLSEDCGLAIALHDDCKTLTGFHIPSGQVAWQHKKNQSKSSSQFLTDFGSIFVLADGRVCILTHKEFFAINPVNGAFLYWLHRFHYPMFTWAAATCYNGNQQKLAISELPETVYVYDVPFEPLEEPSFLPLKDIVSDEETMETS